MLWTSYVKLIEYFFVFYLLFIKNLWDIRSAEGVRTGRGAVASHPNVQKIKYTKILNRKTERPYFV